MRLARVYTREGGEYDVLVLAEDPAGVSLALSEAVEPQHVERVEDRTPEFWPAYFVVRGGA